MFGDWGLGTGKSPLQVPAPFLTSLWRSFGCRIFTSLFAAPMVRFDRRVCFNIVREGPNGTKKRSNEPYNLK